MNLAICGGTFDPFHRGHLEPILAVRDAMAWDRITFVPARRQPFKVKQQAACGHHRFAMTVLATRSHEQVWVSPIELDRDAVSYTVETLEHFRALDPESRIDWVIGDDNLTRLDEWKTLDRIFELANFVVLTRGKAEIPPFVADRVSDAGDRPSAGAVVLAPNATVEVSSTEIRRRVREGEPIASLVHPDVARYIQHNQLYQEKGTL